MSLLEVRDLYTSYDLSQILFGVSLDVARGEGVCLLGRNGVGKTTTLRSIVGLTPPRQGRVVLDGTDITGWPPHRVARQGIGFVPQERRLFADLSVRENLEVARRPAQAGTEPWTVERVYEAFPILPRLDRRRAGYLSGGEQQMLAVGRALMGNPRLLILDEPSEGLAPLVVEAMAEQIAALKAQGMTLLMAEQNVGLALALADGICILDKGHVRFSGSVGEFEADESLRHEYLTV
jgi:branched-chain amino acid transport system ATP-binding protein